MEKNNDRNTAPVKPYDDTIWDRWNIYDNIPYMQDRKICDTGNITLESGNIIKSYRCLIKEPYEVKH